MTDADCKVCGNSFRVLRQKKYYCSPECSFTAKVDRQEDILACWEWNARRSDRGYGELQVNGKKTRANRFAWEFHNKQKIPDGLLVLHSCDNPPCCNPNHLEAVSQKENLEKVLVKIVSLPKLVSHFAQGLIVKNEAEIIALTGEFFRLDRVVLKGKNAIIIDYKTGEEKPAHKKQILQYSDLLGQMG